MLFYLTPLLGYSEVAAKRLPSSLPSLLPGKYVEWERFLPLLL